MAITKIAGELLESNLIRSTNLEFQDGLLTVDVSNNRIGVGTDAPGNFKLDVNGDARIVGNLTIQGTTTTLDSQNLTIEDNILVINSNNSAATDAGIMINRGANDPAVMYFDETDDVFKFGTTTSDGSTRTELSGVTLSKIQIAEPSTSQDAATKNYVDNSISNISTTVGTDVTIGTPADSSFGDGSLTTLGSAPSVTDALDDLNETMENIRASRYVKSVTYTRSPAAGSLGVTVTLAITAVGGGADRYEVNWGDGTTTTENATNPNHDYDENSGQPYTISVKAYNNAATTNSSGSFAHSGNSQTNLVVTVYTTQPVPAFAIYAASSGGSPITIANTGATVYIQNNTTYVAGASTTYNIDWGDNTENNVTGDNGVAGGSSTNSGTRLAHTYTNSAQDDGSTVAGSGAGDTKYQIKLRLLTHSTADPGVVPATTTSNFEVYSSHTAAYSAGGSVIRGVNEQSTSGFPVTFTNNTATLPGANSAFSATQQYTYNFGEGDANTVVAVGSSSSGDTGQTIANTFNLSTLQQGNGTTVAYSTSLSLANGHTGSPSNAAITITVEPDVRAILTATTNLVSTKSGDNQYDLYDVTDLDGTNRALATFTNSSQNSDDYEYDYHNDSSNVLTVQEDGSTAGVVGAALQKNFSGTSAGNFTTDFRATGTPDTINQNSNATINWTMNSTPSAPANLSTKSLTLSDSAQGTSPKLCHGFTDNSSSFTPQSVGDSLNTTTARRYTSGVIDTNTVSNFLTNNSNGTGSTINQTVTAKVNNVSGGARIFTTSEGGSNNTTDATLVTTNHRDYDEVATYPQRLYLVATAKMTLAISGYGVGSSAQRIESSAGGNTNIVYVVKDDITAAPTAIIGTIAQGTAGSQRYISGIPYYNTGSPTVTVTSSTIANFTGQAYQDTSAPVEIDPGTNQESTSGHIIANLDFTYANVDGSTTMLNSGIPKVDTGVSSAYTLGALTVPLLSTQRRSIQQIKMKAKNCNGDSSYSESSTKIQLYTDSLLTLDNEAGGITVSDSLGNGSTHTDDALRISGLGSSSDTPSFNSSTNYYTGNAWSGAVTVAGTTEAISRFGTIKHFTTNLSSGYLPAGPNLTTGRDGGEAQYYTFAFRRTPVSQFSLTMTGTVSGMWIAMPGTGIDSSSGLAGWLNCSVQYNGSGQPGSGGGGNGSDGCAKTGGDRVIDNTAYSNQSFDFTLGTESLANSVGNTCLVRIKLNSGDSVTALSIGVVS
jgi:hypothetical protein